MLLNIKKKIVLQYEDVHLQNSTYVIHYVHITLAVSVSMCFNYDRLKESSSVWHDAVAGLSGNMHH